MNWELCSNFPGHCQHNLAQSPSSCHMEFDYWTSRRPSDHLTFFPFNVHLKLKVLLCT